MTVGRRTADAACYVIASREQRRVREEELTLPDADPAGLHDGHRPNRRELETDDRVDPLDRCDLAVVEDVLAPATLALTDRPVVGDQLNRADPLDHLVTELALKPKAEWRAKRDREWHAIHLVRQDGLWVSGNVEVDDSVEVAVFTSVLPLVVKRSEQQVPRVRERAAPVQAVR